MNEPPIQTASDDGIATVLRALAAIEGLDPVECRVRDSRGEAYVLFSYGRSRRALLEFVADLDPRIHAMAPGVRFLVGLESVGGGTELLARLAFPAASAAGLASALRAAHAQLATVS
jgi:hypothetical protein